MRALVIGVVKRQIGMRHSRCVTVTVTLTTPPPKDILHLKIAALIGFKCMKQIGDRESISEPGDAEHAQRASVQPQPLVTLPAVVSASFTLAVSRTPPPPPSPLSQHHRETDRQKESDRQKEKERERERERETKRKREREREREREDL
jgi:hypothetical protein